MLLSRPVPTFVAVTLFLFVAPAIRAADDATTLHQRFATWLTANFDAKPEFRAQILADADTAIKQGSDILLNADDVNLTNRKPTSISTYAGELFIFQLTTAQAKAVGLYAGNLTLGSHPAGVAAKRLPQPIFQLTDLKIDTPDALPGNQKITGTFTATPLAGAKFGKFSVRIGHRTDAYTTRNLQTYEALPANGTYSFSIDPINRNDRDPFLGPMYIFIDLLLTEGDAPAIASNTAGILVNVQPDHESFARSAIILINDHTNILASVKDRASAAKAVADYTTLAVKNQALTEAMTRVAPPAPERRRELDARYNPMAQALDKKLQAQITRLKQADYAGEAFFDKIQRSIQQATKQ